ncbi:unnamed protein product [Symbiodinium sp. KB8]|nr:unnamed protein product [Symbiodinium sp. KB8]
MVSIALPLHMQLAARNEAAILQALWHLLPLGTHLQPAVTLATRNELVYLAQTSLTTAAFEQLLQLLDKLEAEETGNVIISYPEPRYVNACDSTPAEKTADRHLREGSGSLWVAVRETVRELEYLPDARPFARGRYAKFGLYSKGHGMAQSLAIAILAAGESEPGGVEHHCNSSGGGGIDRFTACILAYDVAEVLLLQRQPESRCVKRRIATEAFVLAEDEGITAIAALCALLVGTMSAVTITGPDCRIRRDVAACQFARWMAAAVLPLQASLILTADNVRLVPPPKVREPVFSAVTIWVYSDSEEDGETALDAAAGDEPVPMDVSSGPEPTAHSSGNGEAASSSSVPIDTGGNSGHNAGLQTFYSAQGSAIPAVFEVDEVDLDAMD